MHQLQTFHAYIPLMMSQLTLYHLLVTLRGKVYMYLFILEVFSGSDILYYTPTRREGAILQSPCPFTLS